jgi:ribosomal protein L37E
MTVICDSCGYARSDAKQACKRCGNPDYIVAKTSGTSQ